MNQPQQTKSNLRQMAAISTTGAKRIADRTAGSIDRLAAERTRLIAEALIDQLEKSDDGKQLDPKYSDKISKLKDSSKLFEPQPESDEPQSIPLPYCRTHVDLEAMKQECTPENSLTKPATSTEASVREGYPSIIGVKLRNEATCDKRLPNNFAGMIEWFRGLAQPIRAE